MNKRLNLLGLKKGNKNKKEFDLRSDRRSKNNSMEENKSEDEASSRSGDPKIEISDIEMNKNED